jgi:methyl-accepting chemotaxis protein
MNWNSLLPSQYRFTDAIQSLAGEETFLQGLTDIFILATWWLGAIMFFWALIETAISFWETSRFMRGLPRPGTGARFEEIRSNWVKNNGYLAQAFDELLVEVSRPGAPLERELRRTGSAEEIFNESSLGHRIIGNRLFMATPGILTGIGVLGTFVGLALGIGALNLEGSAIEDLNSSIVPLIQGSATAFSTSVWGVATSLVFVVLEKFLEGSARWPIRRLQDRLNRLVPRYLPEQSMIELQRSSIESESIVKGLAAAIGKHMQEALDRVGKSVAEALKEALEGKAEGLGEQSAKLMSELLTLELDKLRKAIVDMGAEFKTEFGSTNTQLQETIGSFTSILSGLHEVVTTTRSSVDSAVKRLEGHEAVVTAVGKAALDLDAAAVKLSEMRETFEASAQRNAEAAEAQGAAATSNVAVAKQFEEIGEKLPETRDVIRDAAQIIASLGQPLLDLKEILATTPDLFQEQANRQAENDEVRANRLLTQTESLADAVAEAAEKFAKVETIGKSLSRSAESLESAGASLSTFGSQFQKASQLQAQSAAAAEKAAASSERAAASLAPIPQSIERLGDGLQAAGTSLKTGAEAARDAYVTLIDHQKLWFQGVETGLRSMRDRLQELIQEYGQEVTGQTQKHMNDWVKAVEESLQKFSVQVESLEGALSDFTQKPSER